MNRRIRSICGDCWSGSTLTPRAESRSSCPAAGTRPPESRHPGSIRLPNSHDGLKSRHGVGSPNDYLPSSSIRALNATVLRRTRTKRIEILRKTVRLAGSGTAARTSASTGLLASRRNGPSGWHRRRSPLSGCCISPRGRPIRVVSAPPVPSSPKFPCLHERLHSNSAATRPRPAPFPSVPHGIQVTLGRYSARIQFEPSIPLVDRTAARAWFRRTLTVFQGMGQTKRGPIPLNNPPIHVEVDPGIGQRTHYLSDMRANCTSSTPETAFITTPRSSIIRLGKLRTLYFAINLRPRGEHLLALANCTLPVKRGKTTFSR